MKKMLKFVMVLVVTLICFGGSATAEKNDIKVMIDGEYIEFDTSPQIIEGRTLVPMRTIFEKLGAQVLWDEQSRTVTAISGDNIVKCTINEKEMILNQNQILMDVAPCIIYGRTFVPARFVAEAMNCRVEWNSLEKTVLIFKNLKNDVDNFYRVVDVLYDYLVAENTYNQAMLDIHTDVVNQLKNKNYYSAFCYYDYMKKGFAINYSNHPKFIPSIQPVIEKGKILQNFRVENLSPNLSAIILAYKNWNEQIKSIIDRQRTELTYQDDLSAQMIDNKEITALFTNSIISEAKRLNLEVYIPDVLKPYLN